MSSAKKKKSDKKKKNQQVTQQEISSPSGNKSSIVNGISIGQQNVSVENLNIENEKSNEQTIPEARTQKSDFNYKKNNKKEKTKSKGPVTKKPKNAGFFSLFSIKSLVLFYILAVFFWCNGKTQKQCNSYEEAFCFNGISQYILNNDYFHKYIEPTINVVKQNVDVYGKQALNTVSIQYEAHAKPYVDPLLESAQPHLKTARELVAEGLTKAQVYYNDNAKVHVDNYYDQAVKLSSPYVSQAQEHVSYVYEQASEYNKNTVRPWYHKSVAPYKDKVIVYYDKEMVPFAYHILEIIKKIYHEKIILTYHNHVKPHILTILEFIKSIKESKIEAERKAKEEANRKAKAEAERKAKEESNRKAKAEAERKAKEEADRKAKVEAERKAKEEADRKKAEAEKKAKEEADRKKAEAEKKAKEEADRKKAEAEKKAKEEADRKKAEAEKKAKEEADRKKAEAEKKAKEEAIAAANKAVRNAFNKEFPLVRKNLTLALEDYERKATSIAQETLREVEDRIAFLQKEDLLVNLKKSVEQIKKDSTTKDRKAKFNEIKDSAKKFIDNIKELIETSEKSFENLEGEKFDELKKDFSIILVTQIYTTKNNIYDQADNKKVDDKLKTEIEMTANNIAQEFNENKNNASLRVREIFALIKNKINLLTSIRDDIVKDIHSYIKTELEILKNEANEKIPEKNEKDDNKDMDAPNFVQNQIPVQVEKPTVEKKASSAQDLVLEILKARQDPVLDILKKGYELFKANEVNEPTVRVQSVDNEDEEYYDEGDEESESDECLSDDQ